MISAGVGSRSSLHGGSERARAAIEANRRLRETPVGEALPASTFDILLFLLAEDQGAGVTTSRCCSAVDVPRTTALRWINALIAAGSIEQAEDSADRRVTLLRLTLAAAVSLTAWLEALSVA